MADTLRASLTSVLEQISDQFEVIVVDDASTDNSAEILRELSGKFKNLSVYYLEKNNKRRLGLTRNISFIKASGQWCIFHIDTDDLIGPYITEFAQVIELISKKLDKNMLFSGKQIHMAKREFLIAHGPFKNIYRGEDRDLYQRLSLNGEWIIVDHKRFIYRMERKPAKLLKKIIIDHWDQLVTDMQMSPDPHKYLTESIVRFKDIGLKRILFRVLFVIPALLAAKQRGILTTTDRINDYVQFATYRKEHTKKLSEWKKLLSISDLDVANLDREVFY